MSNKASFQLTTFIFNQVSLNFDKELPLGINVDFQPSGIFKTEDQSFDLVIKFSAKSDEDNKPLVAEVQCIANFKFQNVNTISEIPDFFYRNSVAIIFPYIRAFITTLTAQANIPPLVLPTYNMVDLEQPLRENSITV